MITITAPIPPAHSQSGSASGLTIEGMPPAFTSLAEIEVSEAVPESFLLGWADYQAGHVVDMDQALGDDAPPSM